MECNTFIFTRTKGPKLSTRCIYRCTKAHNTCSFNLILFLLFIHHPVIYLTTFLFVVLKSWISPLTEACLSALCPSIICNHLSSGKKRKPAWTDRILWRLRPKASFPDEQDGNGAGLDVKQLKQLEEDEEYPLKIRQDSYTSIMEYSISDHKPVVGIFTLEVRIWSNTECSTQWLTCSYIICVAHFCWLISLTHPLSSFLTVMPLIGLYIYWRVEQCLFCEENKSC